jgi:hypothetical protein
LTVNAWLNSVCHYQEFVNAYHFPTNSIT